MMQMHWALKKTNSQAKPRSKRRPLEEAVAAGTYDPFVKSQRHLRKAVGKPPPTMLVFTAKPDDSAWPRSQHSASEPTPTGPAIQDAVDLLALSGPVGTTRPKAKESRSHPYTRPTVERPGSNEPTQCSRPSAQKDGTPAHDPADSTEILFNEEMIREMSVLAHSATAAGSLASMYFGNVGSLSCGTPPPNNTTPASSSDSYLQAVLTKRLVNEEQQPCFVPPYLPPMASMMASAPQQAVTVGAGTLEQSPRATCTTGGG